MRGLVTGGAGFVGSHLVDLLLDAGHAVTVLDDLSTGRRSNLARAAAFPEFRFVLGSVLDARAVDDAASGCDTFFHLAAVVGVERVVADPLATIATNISGTHMVLQAAEQHRARVLLTSTGEIYGKNTADALREDDDRILGSLDRSRWSYAESKAVAEMLTVAYWRRSGRSTVVARLFNTVGRRQSGRYGMVVPRMIAQAARGEPLTVHGDGRQTRCFCWVGDVVRALVDLIEQPAAAGRVVNIGSDEEVTIRQLAEQIIAVTGSASTIRHVPYEEAYAPGYEDMRRRVPDTTRARELIGFKPTLTLRDIIGGLLDAPRC